MILMRMAENGAVALQCLLDRYWQPLVRFGQSLGLSEDGAEDLAQEAFLALWKARGRRSVSSSVRAFLFGVVRNLGMKESRRSEARRRLASAALEALYQAPATPHEELDRVRRRRVLIEAIESLPPRRREVLELARFHGLSHDEIADLLGLSKQTVANHIGLALRDLRAALPDPAGSPRR